MYLRAGLIILLIGVCCSQRCNKADVVFLLDESSSIQPTPFKQIKQFVFDVMDGVNVGSGNDKSHVAIVMFSDVAQILFRFNALETQPVDRVKSYLTNRQQRGGSTQTYRGLDLIRRTAFSTSYGARAGNDVAHVCIVITDGNSQLPKRTAETAQKIHNETKIHVFAIGVGNETQIRQSELESIASDKQSVFRVKDASGLDRIKNSISGAACKVVPEKPEEEDEYEFEEDYQWVPTEGTPEEYAEGEEGVITET